VYYMKLETGVPTLDDFLEGGIDRGAATLFIGVPGVEKDSFAVQFLHQRISRGEPAVYVVGDKPPDSIKNELKSIFGWESAELSDKVFFVDCFSLSIGMPSKEKYVVTNLSDLDEFESVLLKALAENKKSVVVLDNVLGMLDEAGAKTVFEHVKKWIREAKTNDVTLLFLFTNWMYAPDTVNSLKSMFDIIVNFEAIEEKVVLRSYFQIEKAFDKKFDASVPFKVSKPGGVFVYVPKILVTGAYHSGKSSFIHAISTQAVSVDRLGTTVALDHGYVEYKGMAADLFGTPGQERFDAILENNPVFEKETVGVFLVIDSSNPDTFGRSFELLEKTMSKGLPYVVVANKQDLPNALPLDEIRQKMRLPLAVPIVAASVREGKGLHEAMEALFGLLFAKKTQQP